MKITEMSDKIQTSSDKKTYRKNLCKAFLLCVHRIEFIQNESETCILKPKRLLLQSFTEYPKWCSSLIDYKLRNQKLDEEEKRIKFYNILSLDLYDTCRLILLLQKYLIKENVFDEDERVFQKICLAKIENCAYKYNNVIVVKNIFSSIQTSKTHTEVIENTNKNVVVNITNISNIYNNINKTNFVINNKIIMNFHCFEKNRYSEYKNRWTFNNKDTYGKRIKFQSIKYTANNSKYNQNLRRENYLQNTKNNRYLAIVNARNK